jgi:hypothetical protein
MSKYIFTLLLQGKNPSIGKEAIRISLLIILFIFFIFDSEVFAKSVMIIDCNRKVISDVKKYSNNFEKNIILNGLESYGYPGLICLNNKLISRNNKLGFSFEIGWNIPAQTIAWWSISQKLSSVISLKKFDRLAFDLYLAKPDQSTLLRIYLKEEDGDRWVVSEVPLNSTLKSERWHHFEISKEQMRPWLLGNKKLDWDSINQLVIEPASASSKEPKSTKFLIDGVKLLESQNQEFQVFNTNDDGDRIHSSSNIKVQRLPRPGIIYLPGLGHEHLHSTLRHFQKLLGPVGTSYTLGSRATALSNIPTMTYTGLVQGYEKFLTRRGAWDVNAAGRGPGTIPLLQQSFSSFHTIALAHPGVDLAVRHRIDNMIRGGIGIFTAIDYTFPWQQGPFGYSRTMVSAYRANLKALDSGLQIVDNNVNKTIHFPEYFRSYHGFFPRPQDLNLPNWDFFTPPRSFRQTHPERAYWRLFMFLRSYEWLKLADRTGQYLQQRGGHGLWAAPNPEDIHGSSDYIMLLRSKGVTNLFPEWFGRIATLSSAAYLSGAYLQEQANKGKSRLSVLFETGVGGHSKPYWDWQTAFNGAYAITAATQAHDFDNDFVDHVPFQQMSNPKTHPGEFNRFRDTVAKALGFQLASHHKAKRLKSKILCVSERPPGKNVSSFLHTVADKRRPGLAASLWRQNVIFDIRDSFELEQVINRYDMVFYDVLSPRMGDLQRIKTWLRAKPNRVLITHSFVPTRTSQGYWDSDSGAQFGAIPDAGLGMGTLSPTTRNVGSIIHRDDSWRSFLPIGQTINLSEGLVKSQYGRALVTLDSGVLVSETTVGQSKVIYFHYPPGLSDKTRSLDDQLTLALMNYLKVQQVASGNPNTAIQAFKIPGGQSIVVWDMPTEDQWVFKNEPDNPPLRWKAQGVNHNIRLFVGRKNKPFLIYDFWANQIFSSQPKDGYLNLSLQDVSSKIFFVGESSGEITKTIAHIRSIRLKMTHLQFDSHN